MFKLFRIHHTALNIISKHFEQPPAAELGRSWTLLDAICAQVRRETLHVPASQGAAPDARATMHNILIF